MFLESFKLMSNKWQIVQKIDFIFTSNKRLGKIKMKNIILIASISFFALALTQNCYSTDFKGNNDASMPAILALLIGWLGVLGIHGPAISWLANPFLIASWITFGQNSKYALPLSIITLVLMLSFLFFKKILVTEAGHVANITKYELGYWLWIGSALIIVAGKFILATDQL